MNKIKKIAENVYYSIFNIVDYASYTFFHFFFGADIVTKVVVVALALVGLFFLVKALFSLAVTLATMKVVSIAATLVLKALLFLIKATGNLFLFVFVPLGFFGLTKPFKAKYRGKKRSKSVKGKEE